MKLSFLNNLIFILIFLMFSNFSIASNEVKKFTEILKAGTIDYPVCERVTKNNSCQVVQRKARNYCESEGKYLGTVLDYAYLAKSRGAVGPISVSKYKEIQRQGGDGHTYYFYAAKSKYDSEVQLFYYSKDGYIPPSLPELRERIWTSSNQYMSDGNTYIKLRDVFFFVGSTGDIRYLTNPHEIPYSVQCVIED